MSSILRKIPQFDFPPRYAPEWGSGGIFGMKYHRGTLIYTLAFEAEVHLQRDQGEMVYGFEPIGEPPRSGGDTYNAVEAVDDQIYFGGWVHAPAAYGRETGQPGGLSFANKFSHLHSYDTKEGKVDLLWKDTLADGSRWAGEVSQLVYEPVGDRVLMARSDGHEHLGVFSYDRGKKRVERLTETPALKGALHLDGVCFDVRRDWTKGVEGIQTLDPATGGWSEMGVDFVRDSVDGDGTWWPNACCAVSAYSRLFFFTRGGVLVGDPTGRLEKMRFVRLFDFRTDYSPARGVAKAVGGGILVPFSAYSQSFLRSKDGSEEEAKAKANFVNGPSVLVYITPPQARVVAALGGRITTFEKVGDRLVVGASTAANLGADDPTPVDTGHRDLSIFELGALLNGNPPLTFRVMGGHVMGDTWGGVPLAGRKEAELRLTLARENALTIYEYDLSLPAQKARTETVGLKEGTQTLDLTAYRGVVSFRLGAPDPQAQFRVALA